MAVSNLVAMLVFRTIMAPSAEHLVQAVGWRTAQRYAASICVGPAVLCALLVRHTPESVGMRPDGVELEQPQDMDDEEQAPLLSSSSDDEAPTGAGQPADVDKSFTVREAFATLALYMLSADTVVGGMFGAGMG